MAQPSGRTTAWPYWRAREVARAGGRRGDDCRRGRCGRRDDEHRKRADRCGRGDRAPGHHRGSRAAQARGGRDQARCGSVARIRAGARGEVLCRRDLRRRDHQATRLRLAQHSLDRDRSRHHRQPVRERIGRARARHWMGRLAATVGGDGRLRVGDRDQERSRFLVLSPSAERCKTFWFRSTTTPGSFQRCC